MAPSNRPRISFDRVASLYDSTRTIPDGALETLGTVLDREYPGRRLLEVGVGTGRIACPLAARGHWLVGTDVAAAMLRRARGKGLARLVRAEAARLPLRAASVDCAMTNHLLHLVADWPSALREILRVSREAYLTVAEHERSTPDPEAEYQRRVTEGGAPTRRPGLHERRFPSLLAPDATFSLGHFRTTQDATSLLETLSGRPFSYQWNIAASLHERTLDTLRSEYAGVRVDSEVTVELFVWSRDRALELARIGETLEPGAEPDRGSQRPDRTGLNP